MDSGCVPGAGISSRLSRTRASVEVKTPIGIAIADRRKTMTVVESKKETLYVLVLQAVHSVVIVRPAGAFVQSTGCIRLD